MANKLVCTGRNVLYAGAPVPQPATITIDIETGKIIQVLPNYLPGDARHTEEGITLIDAGDRIVLPGLVECVILSTMKLG
jgi:allantoinase